MNGFTKKRVGTMTLGERLKKMRGDRRLSLFEISRVTKIQSTYLESLEEGDYDKLPADVYVKGFIRSYAEFLNVDDKPLIRIFEKEKGIKKNLEKNRNPQNGKNKIEPISISSFVFTPGKIATTLGILLLFFGFFYLYREIGNFASVPRLVVLNPAPDSETQEDSIFVEGVTEKEAKLFINDQPIFVGEDGRFREKISLQNGVNIINLKAVNRFEKETSESITIQSSAKEEMTGGGEDEQDRKKIEELGGNEIQIELKVDPGPVWISVEADGSLVFSGTMLSGSTQNFNAEEKIIISSGRANATFVKFNGKDIGTLGQDPGTLKGVVFTKDTKY